MTRILDCCSKLTLAVGLWYSLAALGAGPGAVSDADDGVYHAEALSAVTALLLEPRGGWGPFYIRTSPLASDHYPPAQEFPSDEWECAAQEVHAPANIVTILWSGCRVDHLERLEDPSAYAGDFDVAVIFSKRDADSVDIQMWVDNRLAVGIGRFRYVMRLAQESLPENPDEMTALFGYDDYIESPLENLRSIVPTSAWLNQVAFFEGDTGRHFVRNRGKVNSMLSLHTPDWGFVLHGTDPDNADPGWLLLGSNPDKHGEPGIEFGYQYKLQGEYEAGNGRAGPMQMGPTLRGKTLPAERPLDTAWWEALDAYVPYLENETDLLAGFDLTHGTFPAQWAQDCLFAAWIVIPDDLSLFVDEFQAVVNYYSDPNQEPLVFCPMLWGFHTYAPRMPRQAAVKLLAQMQEMATTSNVELHPGAYYLPWIADYDRLNGHPIKDAVILNAIGEPNINNDGTVMVAQNHPAVLEDVRQTIDMEYDLGIHYIYHDNPFREMVGWKPWAESSRDYHVNTRGMIQMMGEQLTARGGGLVAIEGGRLGLNAMQAGAGGITNSMIPGGQSSSFSDALFHGRYLTAFSGDLVGESYNIVFADARLHPWLCLPSEDVEVTLECPYDAGMVNNVDHMPRLAMTAALGRSIIDPLPNLRMVANDPLSPQWLKEAFANYLTATRNAYWTRRNTPALRTGRMLPTPPSDKQRVVYETRTLVSNPPRWSHKTNKRRVDAYPAGFFKDLEADNKYVLVVGNPIDDQDGLSAVVRFRLELSEYGQLVYSDVHGAKGILSDDGQTLTLEVLVPPLEFTVVELTPPVVPH